MRRLADAVSPTKRTSGNHWNPLTRVERQKGAEHANGGYVANFHFLPMKYDTH
jgi:hypothetical protein